MTLGHIPASKVIRWLHDCGHVVLVSWQRSQVDHYATVSLLQQPRDSRKWVHTVMRWYTHEKSLSRLGHSIVMNVVLLVKTLYWLVAQRQTAFVQRSGWTCFITLTVNQTMFYGSRVIKNGFEKFLLQEHDLTPTAAEVQLCGIVNEFGQSWWGKYFNCLVTTK